LPLVRAAAEELREIDPSQIRGLDDPVIFEEVLRRMVEDSRIHNPINEISKISPMPLLIIHGTDDVGIPLAGVKRLYELAGDPKDLVIVEGADHNLTDPRAYEITMETAVQWLKEAYETAG
jgi:fermentation-respiration switch protein FrsA (DUF1100 family)